MFDELKEVNSFKEKTGFKNFILENTLMNRLKSLRKEEAYLEPKRASTMELFYEYTGQLPIFAIRAPS